MLPLRKGQIDALKAFKTHFYNEENDRGVLSACCGFGKTRLCYEILKECIKEGEDKFIIATSRVLLSSTFLKNIRNWFRKEQIKIDIYRVGGENVKGITELRNEKDILNYFKSKGPKVIVSTYKSGYKILEGLKDREEVQPDLIIFDEAHNTTGDNNKYYQDLIKLTSEKKLFMTATPLKLLFKNKDGIEEEYIKELTYTMDNEDTYGKIFFEYTFYQGIKDKIIVDFLTITLGKKDNCELEIKEFRKKIRNKSKKEKQDIYFKMIAELLLNTMKSYNLNHTLVFLSDQSKAKGFYEILEKLKKTHEVKPDIYTITSDNTKTERERNEREFKAKDDNKKILLSVGIYNEGADIPCIDSVLFAHERTSPSTIVQNIGRCVRTHKDKKVAYVILPNVLYDYGEEWESETKFSTKFKQIRKMIDILGKGETSILEKHVRTKNKDELDEESDDYLDLEDDLSDEDEVDIAKQKDNTGEKIVTKTLSHDIKTDMPSISDMFKIQCLDKDISNMTLERLKIKIKGKVNTIKEYVKFIKNDNLSIDDPDRTFSREWISWGDFLVDKTFTYEEAKKFIREKLDLTNVHTIEDWHDLWHKIIADEIWTEKSFNHIDEFIKLPSKPKDYYKSEFISYDDYLGKILNITGFVTDPNKLSQYDKNADRNVNLLVNDDSKKIKKKLTYIDFDTKINLNLTKKLIDDTFKIDSILKPQIKYKVSGKFENIIVLAFEKNKPHKIISKININSPYYFEYNSNIWSKDIFDKQDNATLNDKKLINDKNVINELNQLKLEAKNDKDDNMKTDGDKNIIVKKKKKEIMKELYDVAIVGKQYYGCVSLTGEECKEAKFIEKENGAIELIHGKHKIGVVNKNQSQFIKKLIDNNHKYNLTLGQGQTNLVTKVNVTYYE